MQSNFVTTQDGGVLRAVRSVLDESDDALFCVAFMSEGGLELLWDEISSRRKRNARLRLLVTTAFGSTTLEGLKAAGTLGVDLGIFNKSIGTYHPKVYLGRSEDRAHAFIGSANLTSGLAGNVEAGMQFDGHRDHEIFISAWSWAENLWDRASQPAVTEYYQRETLPAEVIDPDLLPLIGNAVEKDPVVKTLDRALPNVVVAWNERGLWIATDATAKKASGAQEVPAWMVNVAWRALKLRGELRNMTLQDELRVKRSSFVCALLARLPGVEAKTKPIRLIWRG